MRKIIILSAFLLFFTNLLGQNATYEELDCKFYYDTVLRKDVYQNVEIFPSYDKDGIANFTKKIDEYIKKKKIVTSQQEALWNSRIIVSFVVSEKGYLENVQIVGKKVGDYSIIDKEVLKIINRLRCKKWSVGICNNKKVPTLVYIPVRINYHY